MSCKDHGTLGHFRTLLSRVTITGEPKKDVDACVDLLVTVFTGYIVAAACIHLGIDNPSDDLPSGAIPVDLHKASSDSQKKYLFNIAGLIANKLTIIENAFKEEGLKDPASDGVNNYAQVLCHYASLVIEFIDACNEGDGKRVLRCWKLFLPHFYAAHRTKYALEALNIQIQLITMPPQLSHELTWSRFVNTHGSQGYNIPCDLANEHINKQIKEIIANMGSNFSEDALKRAARSVTFVSKFSQLYDKQSAVPVTSNHHSTKSSKQDIEKVVTTVLKEKILTQVPGRKQLSFCVSNNPLKSLQWVDLLTWLKKKHSQAVKRKGAVQPDQEIDDADEISDDIPLS